MTTQLTIALSKGRIFEESLPFLAKAGISILDNPETSRKLILQTNHDHIQVVILRTTDVPTYVQYGAADFGIAGKDVLIQHGEMGLYQPLDLEIGKCKMMVAAHQNFDYEKASKIGSRLRVATKYPDIAKEHFAQKGIHVDIIKLYGSMELAPLVNLCDVIVDIVSTGNTLRANNLKPVEFIMDISSRLIVNKAALRLKYTAIQPIINIFATHQ